VFAGPSYSKSNIGAGAQCWETKAQLNGGNCGNTGGRAFTVNGATQTCSGSNWSSVPAAKNGGYCLAIAAGDGNDGWFSLW
jgi:hypothetical protein